jgi:hypothetical protein
MVNSKDFNQDYNSYYRPTPDRNDPDFFPKQGTLPLYFFKNGILQNEEPLLQNTATEVQFIEEPNYNIQHETNYLIPFLILLGFIIVFFVCYNCCKKRKYVKNFNKAVYRPRTTPYYTFDEKIILYC